MDQAQATGFGVALVGHAALLAALILLARSAGESVPPAPAIEVSFAEDVGDITSAPVPTSQPPAAGAAADPGPPEDAAPPEQPAPPLPEPRPAPTPEPQPRRAQPQQRQAETPPRQQQQTQPQQRPAERTRRVTEGLDPRSFGSDPASTSTTPPASVSGEARASIDAAIRRALIPCQRQPLPAPEAAAIRVRLNVTLNRDGSLARTEVVRVENSDPALEMYERRMQDLARNVITQCTPIRGLPPEYYDVPRGWRQFPFVFDPRSR